MRADGTVACWGGDEGLRSCVVRGQETVTSELGAALGDVDCSVGEDAEGPLFSCRQMGPESMECRDPRRDIDQGQAHPPDGQFSALAAGGSHTCGLRADGAAECWGSNHVSRWDEDAEETVYVQTGQSDPPDGQFTAITAGGDHTCGLRDDGTVECWGANHADSWGDYEYLGQADPPEGRFTAISAGDRYTCGIRADGAIVFVCWGDSPEPPTL